MTSAIDHAGRVVIPKAIRDQMGLTAGSAVDFLFVDGHIEIVWPPMDVKVEIEDGLPAIVPLSDAAAVSDADVRRARDASRR